MDKYQAISSLTTRIMVLCVSIAIFSTIMTYQIITKGGSGFSVIATLLSAVLVITNMNYLSEIVTKIKNNLPSGRRLD